MIKILLLSALILSILALPQAKVFADHCVILGSEITGGGGGEPEPPAIENRTGIYIPLYVNPSTGGSAWNPLVDIIADHPDVPFLITINPSSGVGGAQSSNFVAGIDNLQDYPNVIVIGYVFTSNGLRDIGDIETEIDLYEDWYNVEGIMFDEFNAQDDTYLSYYAEIRDYVNDNTSFNYTRGNWGADIDSSFADNAIVDNFGIREGYTWPSIGYLDGWHDGYNKSYWSYELKDVTSTEWDEHQDFIIESTQHVKYLYFTSDGAGGSNPWDTISVYTDELATLLESTY